MVDSIETGWVTKYLTELEGMDTRKAVTGQQLGSGERRGFPSSGEVYEFLHRRDGENDSRPREVAGKVGPEGYSRVFEPRSGGDFESYGRDD